MFPYCGRCFEHATRWSSAATFANTVIGIGVVLAVIIGLASSGVAGIATFAAFLIGGVVVFVHQRSEARARCTPGCASPSPAVDHLGWSGSVSSFAFHSQTYAVKFANENSRNLINVSMELRRLLERRSTTAQVEVEVSASIPMRVRTSLPSAAPDRAPSGDAALDWISRIENYKGTEARRHALERALKDVTEPRARWELMSAACRIEVAAVLDKLDNLSTVAAKRRHLQKAIDEMRSSPIPEEIQARYRRELGQHLTELGSE